MNRYEVNDTMKMIGKQPVIMAGKGADKQIRDVIAAYKATGQDNIVKMYESGTLLMLLSDIYNLGLISGENRAMQNRKPMNNPKS